MSDEAPPPAKPEAASGGKSSKGPLILGIVNLLVTGLIEFKVMTAQPAAEAEPSHEGHGAEPTSDVTGPVVALDPFVVNLDEPGTPRYLKMTLELELYGGAGGGHGEGGGEQMLAKSKQLIRDVILSHISG